MSKKVLGLSACVMAGGCLKVHGVPVAHFEGARGEVEEKDAVEVGIGFIAEVKRARREQMGTQERKVPKSRGVLFHVEVPELVSDGPLLSCDVKRGCRGGQLRVEVDGFGGELHMGCGGGRSDGGLKLVSGLSESGVDA